MSSFRFYYTKEKSDLYVYIISNRYENKNLRVDLWEGGWPFFLLSEEVDCILGTNEFVLRDCDGAQEILQAMMNNKLVKQLNKKVKEGGIVYQVYKLLIK